MITSRRFSCIARSFLIRKGSDMCECFGCCGSATGGEYFIVRRDETPLEYSGYIFRVVAQDSNVVVARKVNHCCNERDRTHTYTFDRKRWCITPVSACIAEAAKGKCS